MVLIRLGKRVYNIFGIRRKDHKLRSMIEDMIYRGRKMTFMELAYIEDKTIVEAVV